MSALADDPPNRRDARAMLWISCLAFLTVGMAQASLGPALPDLSRQTGASTVAVGGAFSTLFTGSLAGFTVTGSLLRRWGHLKMLTAGWTVFALALAGVAFSRNLAMLLTCAAVLGFGTVSLILTVNVLAAQASRGPGALNLVNAVFGVGAIASPALVGLSMTTLGLGMPAIWLIVGVALAGLVLLLGQHPARASAPAPAPPEDRAETMRHRMEALRSPLLWAICAFFFTYVSIEVSINAWLPTLLNRATGLSPAGGAAVLSWVWLLMTGVRFAAAWAGRQVPPQRTLRSSVAACVVGGALMIAGAAGQSQPLAIAAASVLGMALAPIMPTMMALVQAAFRRDAGWASGVAMAFGSVGAAVVPWALGATVVNVGAAAGASILFFAPLALALWLAVVEWQMRHHAAAAPA